MLLSDKQIHLLSQRSNVSVDIPGHPAQYLYLETVSNLRDVQERLDQQETGATARIMTSAEIAARPEPLITPFVPRAVREVDGRPVISYGLAPHGYDLRPADVFRLLRPGPALLDPKTVTEEDYEVVQGQGYVDVPPGGLVLAYSLERLSLPRTLNGLVLTKSTYARVGLNCVQTKLNAGWAGHVTLEYLNSTQRTIRLHANEGAAYVEFNEVPECLIDYNDSGGRYQNQAAEATLPKV